MQCSVTEGAQVTDTRGGTITDNGNFSCGVQLPTILSCIQNKILYIKCVDQMIMMMMMMMMMKRIERVHTWQDDKHLHNETDRQMTEDELAWERAK
jgi:hypothetical protein